MIYKFAFIADIHWGAMDSKTLCKHLELFLEFIRQKKDLDFVVIGGDYYDYRLQLNSETALLAINWFDTLVETCKSVGISKIRVIKGTRDHDNDQLEAFRGRYVKDDGGFVKIINTTEVEELLPGLKCIYCPDENLNPVDYEEKYWNKFLGGINIGFFHGNFDKVLPSIEYQRIMEKNLPTMIYHYEQLSRFIDGPLIAGHWHIYTNEDSLFYSGSFDRWKWGEEKPKGFLYGEYNTDNNKYFVRLVENILAPVYETIMLFSNEVVHPAEFAAIRDMILTTKKNDPTRKLKIIYYINTVDAETGILNFKEFSKGFVSDRSVKTDMKDLIERKDKKIKKKITKEQVNKYNYIYDDIPISEKIHRFIIDKKGIDLPVDTVKKYIDKYLEYGK